MDTHMVANSMPWKDFQKFWRILVKEGWKLSHSDLGEYEYFSPDRSIKLGSREEVVNYVKALQT